MSLQDKLKEIDSMSKEELERISGRKFIVQEGEFKITEEKQKEDKK